MAVTEPAMQAEAHEPRAEGDPMGTPAADETVLWKGKPDRAVLARTAFHTRSVGAYFTLLVGISIYLGNPTVAITCTVLGLAALGILNAIAWLSARTTLYILTDTRLIMRIGMALQARINVPLKHVQSADLRTRKGGHGDIALTLGGERLLGYALLWPHARPWRINRPQPMLRAVPEAETVAAMLADACAAVVPIERADASVAKPVNAPASTPPRCAAPGKPQRSHGTLEGAPA